MRTSVKMHKRRLKSGKVVSVRQHTAERKRGMISLDPRLTGLTDEDFEDVFPTSKIKDAYGDYWKWAVDAYADENHPDFDYNWKKTHQRLAKKINKDKAERAIHNVVGDGMFRGYGAKPPKEVSDKLKSGYGVSGEKYRQDRENYDRKAHNFSRNMRKLSLKMARYPNSWYK